MSLDYTEVMIGPPERVAERVLARVGQLNFSSVNIRTGITTDPPASLSRYRRDQPWQVMKLLYATHSFAQAREMAARLRAWDAKLFLEPEVPFALSQPEPYYAFVLLR